MTKQYNYDCEVENLCLHGKKGIMFETIQCKLMKTKIIELMVMDNFNSFLTNSSHKIIMPQSKNTVFVYYCKVENSCLHWKKGLNV